MRSPILELMTKTETPSDCSLCYNLDTILLPEEVCKGCRAKPEIFRAACCECSAQLDFVGCSGATIFHNSMCDSCNASYLADVAANTAK